MFNLSSNNKTSIPLKKPQRHNHFLKISMFTKCTSRDWGRGLHNYETTQPLALCNTCLLHDNIQKRGQNVFPSFI